MPLGSYMRAVLKNNKGIKRKKKNKFKEKSLTEKGKLDFSHLPNSTPKQLIEIKSKLKKESTKTALFRLGIFIIVILALLYFIVSLFV